MLVSQCHVRQVSRAERTMPPQAGAAGRARRSLTRWADGGALTSGHQLTLQDLDLDGGHVWAVDASGVLGYVVHPSLSLEVIAEAIDDLAASGDCPDPAYAARAAVDKVLGGCLDFVAACRAGVVA